MASIQLRNRKIWITGATSGIGLEMAKILIESGNQLIVTARSESRLNDLKQLSPDNIDILPVDIATQCSTRVMTKLLTDITDSLDTVILNAGTCEYIDVNNFDIDVMERVTQVNYLGFARCVAAALPFLRRSSLNPHLVGVSSAAAYTGLPRSEAYGASKAAVRHFLQALRLDLAPLGIDVSIVYPGFVDTPLTRKNDFPMPFLMGQQKAVELMLRGMERRKLEIAFPRRLIWPLRLLAGLPVNLSMMLAGLIVRDSKAKP